MHASDDDTNPRGSANAGDGSNERWPRATDDELVAGMRAAEAGAVDEFIARFEPAIRRYAIWLRIPGDERSHWTGEVLFDVARTLQRRSAAIGCDLPRYVAGACRWKAKRFHEDERRRAARARARAQDVGGTGELVEPEGCSEHALRLVRGADWEAPPLPPVLERLIAALEEGISASERELLSWLSEHVSYTTIAAWLSISRPAAVSRAQRLRKRLIEVTCRFGGSLNEQDSVALVRFLRRTGAIPESRITTLSRESAAIPRAKRTNV